MFTDTLLRRVINAFAGHATRVLSGRVPKIKQSHCLRDLGFLT